MSDAIWFLDTLMEVTVPAAATGGTHTVLTCTAPHGHMPPPHVHAGEAETFVVLEGELTFHTMDGETVVRAGEGAHGPAGEPHTFAVTSQGGAKFLLIAAPAGFEAFVRDFGVPAERRELPVLDGPPDVERLMAVAAEHGITFVGPPGTTPLQAAAATG